jgi:acid phosphatase type 7
MKLTLILICCSVLLACEGLTAPQTVVLVGAGDIAGCNSNGDEITAKLVVGVLEQHSSASVFTLGDNVYPNGTSAEFANCYNPSWGSFKARTHPVPGNHDYNTANATGYYGYYGAKAGDSSKGYYSYNLGVWHIVVVNSNCAAIGGCETGSSQEKWLQSDLKTSPSKCQIVMWHHPRFSSGAEHSNADFMQDIWKAVAENQVELVLSGHEHTYERFASMNAAGEADSGGTTEIVVGSGGISHYHLGIKKPNSQTFNADTYGVLRLELAASSYNFKFLPEPGKTFTDSGAGVCR